MKPEKVRSVLQRGSLVVLGNVLVLVAILIVVEGLAGWTVAIRKIGDDRVAERLHTRYDPELGWVSLPNVRRIGMYGPGNDLHTNSRGFRGQTEYTQAVPTDRIRLVCSGDSFTLGYGVGDEDTWCHRLQARDARLETVNMGQGGYGIDQAYLWYRRDARDLDHDLHIFAFISDDFRRMTKPTFLGYPKPLLVLQSDTLVIVNKPVPKRSLSGWFTANADAIGALRITEIGQAASKRLFGNSKSKDEKDTVFGKATVVMPKLLADLKRLNEQRGSQLVLVYLPSTYDLKSGAPRKWSAFLEEQSRALGVTFIDLYPQFRAMTSDSLQKLFLRAEDLEFKAAAGHLNRGGNDLVAELIHNELSKRHLLR